MGDLKANGCLKSKYDIRDFRLRKKVSMCIDLPDYYDCDKLPAVKDQGIVGSCVPHATAEILEYFANCEKKFSTNFIYGIHNKLYGSKGPGMCLREACKIVKHYGDPEYVFCPENTEVKEVYEIANKAFSDVDARNNAFQYRIKSFAKLYNNTEIKYSLITYGPVLCSIIWHDENKVVNGYLVKDGEKYGGHAIMVYGYNDYGFLCLNSWGEDWGLNGKFILPYSYGISEAYALIPRDKNETNVVRPTRGKFLDFIYKIINKIVNLFYDEDSDRYSKLFTKY